MTLSSTGHFVGTSGSWFLTNFTDVSDEFFDWLDFFCDEDDTKDRKMKAGQRDAALVPKHCSDFSSPSRSWTNEFGANSCDYASKLPRNPFQVKQRRIPQVLPSQVEDNTPGGQQATLIKSPSPVSVLEINRSFNTPEILAANTSSLSYPEKRPRESPLHEKPWDPAKRRRKEEDQSLQQPDQPRRCVHCAATGSPMWRVGPNGPKTLCNACGIRYKTGRLFPEYRPIASPTYVPSLHSHFHKKVIRIREATNCEHTEVAANTQRPSQ
ncbi:GATA transcription factor 8 [Rhodamnia argentea]|uniref:GATA transcription factor 8 n=1 Tax=Rhodamnia argentea TaxID=178133 RepID=A0ABM3HJG6_9MYRT|nr:GATA transcription factor 8 [Rhodamnia argentea]